MESQDIYSAFVDNLEESVAVDGLFLRGVAFALVLSSPVWAAVIVASWWLLS